MSLVATDWLEKNINKVKILDASWHMPNSKRNGYEEYKKEHIKNSIFFDIDNFSNKKNNLPHMLPDSKEWKKLQRDRERFEKSLLKGATKRSKKDRLKIESTGLKFARKFYQKGEQDDGSEE